MKKRKLVGGLVIVLGIGVSLWAHFTKEAHKGRSPEASAWSDEDPSLATIVSETGLATGLPLVGLGLLIARWPES